MVEHSGIRIRYRLSLNTAVRSPGRNPCMTDTDSPRQQPIPLSHSPDRLWLQLPCFQCPGASVETLYSGWQNTCLILPYPPPGCLGHYWAVWSTPLTALIRAGINVTKNVSHVAFTSKQSIAPPPSTNRAVTPHHNRLPSPSLALYCHLFKDRPFPRTPPPRRTASIWDRPS